MTSNSACSLMIFGGAALALACPVGLLVHFGLF